MPLSMVSFPPTDFFLVVTVFSLPAGTGYCRSVERELVRSVIKALISEPDSWPPVPREAAEFDTTASAPQADGRGSAGLPWITCLGSICRCQICWHPCGL